MLVWVMLGAVLALALFPESLSSWRKVLFALTERVRRELTPLRILFWIAVAIAAVAFAQILAGDLAWLAAIDAATYLEIAAAVALTGAVVRVRALYRSAVIVLRRGAAMLGRPVRRVMRAVRVRMSGPRKTEPSKDDGAPSWVWAAA